MSVIQQIVLEDKTTIFIKGIKPDEGDFKSGEITLNGSPVRLERVERYHVEGELLVTDSYSIPMFYIQNFLAENDCLQEIDGIPYVIFKEVIFKLN